MEKQKNVIADILALLLLTISVVSYIPKIINFSDFLSNGTYILYSLLILLASFSLFFVAKYLPQSQKWQKTISIIGLSVCFLLCIATLFFFKNDTGSEYSLAYNKIKTFLPYFYSLGLFYTCNSIKDNDKRFEMMIYLCVFYYVIGFLSLDIDGIILVSLAGIIYSFVNVKSHLVKIIIFVLVSVFILFVILLSIDVWSEYFLLNKVSILKNRNTEEILLHSTFLPTDHFYSGDNYLSSLTNSFGLLGLIVSSLVFSGLCAVNISMAKSIEYWVFVVAIYLLSFVSIIFKVLNFEFYLFSPSLPTIALNSICLGLIANKNE